MQCPYCKGFLDYSAKFCPFCGSPLTPIEPLSTSTLGISIPKNEPSPSSSPEIELITSYAPPNNFKAMYHASKRGFIFLIGWILILSFTTASFGILYVQTVTNDPYQQQLATLLEQYNDLFVEFQNLEEILNEPYTSIITPTVVQLQSWLEQDTTDEIPYEVGKWMCGDYAAMLMVKAKAQHWRMRVAVISYSLDTDPQYGVNTAWGSTAHAFNIINCTTGTWYIEPQSDAMFWFPSDPFHNLFEDIWEYIDNTAVNTGTIWDGKIFWVNSYNYFG